MTKRKTIVAMAVLLALGTGFLVYHRLVLNSADFERAVRERLPIGSAKVDVINFLQAKNPRLLDDYGQQVKARFTGLAPNVIYRNDVIVTFEFDPSGKLRSYSLKSYFTFL